MLIQAFLFFVGLGLLYLGAEWLVDGAASLALRYGIRPLIVGITIVAMGTSMPEFVVNFIAAISGEDSLALGNIVGSNICNIALILGTSSLVIPLAVSPTMLKKEYPIMIAVLVLFYAVALDGTIARLDGLLLVGCLIAFMAYLILDAKRHTGPAVTRGEADLPGTQPDYALWQKAALVTAGILLLAAGAHLMVSAAVTVANVLGIDPIIIGLTVVAVGTSLPELAASIVSALKQEADISIGNVLGSNMANVLFVIGTISLFQPLQVDETSLAVHFPVMIAFSLLLFPIAWTQFKISRMEGGFLLAGFVGYVYLLAVPYI